MHFSPFSLVLLVCSVILGSICAFLSSQYGSVSEQYSKWQKRRETPLSEEYGRWLQKNQLYQQLGGISSSRTVPESDYLRAVVPTLCTVLLTGKESAWRRWQRRRKNLETSVFAIGSTWGARCAKTLYFSNHHLLKPVGLEVIVLDGADMQSWAVTMEVLLYVVRAGYLEKYDWFYQAEEDTYVIVDNLLYFLSVRNVTTPAYLGHARTSWGAAYNAAGPGYVLSTSALRKLHSHLVKGHCTGGWKGAADVRLGQCLAEMGIVVEDTRDTLGRARFLVDQPEPLLAPGNFHWLTKMWTDSKYYSPEVGFVL